MVAGEGQHPSPEARNPTAQRYPRWAFVKDGRYAVSIVTTRAQEFQCSLESYKRLRR